MTVRKITETGQVGYGVVGQAYGNPTEPIIINMRDICNEIPLKVFDPFEEDLIFTHHVVSLMWRFSVSIGIADMETIKQYFNPTGKAQFGRYVMSAFGYVTDEQFISYAKIKSALYTCRVLYAEGERFDGEPCDEPQVDLPSIPAEVGGFHPYSGNTGTFKGSFAEIPSGYARPIADAAAIWVPETVAALNVGVTYMFNQIPYTTSAFVEQNEPPIIIF